MWFTYVRDENVSKNLKEVNVKNACGSGEEDKEEEVW